MGKRNKGRKVKMGVEGGMVKKGERKDKKMMEGGGRQ